LITKGTSSFNPIFPADFSVIYERASATNKLVGRFDDFIARLLLQMFWPGGMIPTLFDFLSHGFHRDLLQ
jgi:hypothetical protein